MGLFDFLNDKGEKTPIQPQQPTTTGAGGDVDFFGNPTPATTSAVTGETYTVQSGDSLSTIAKNHYGDASKWRQIYEANQATIGNNPDLIEVGQVLTLPSN